MDQKSVILKVAEKIASGENLSTELEKVINIDGVPKLQRKIRQEIEFLRKLKGSKIIKEEQLSCSNLKHLGAMAEYSLRPGVVSVCKLFHIGEDTKLVVDIISDEGKTWTKVIARNPKSLSALSLGKASYGARSILDQAKDYLRCAKLYPCMYKPPKVVFEFVSGVEEKLSNKLKSLGIQIKGNILPNTTNYDYEESSDEDNEDDLLNEFEPSTNYSNLQQVEDHSEINLINLDVTAMMAYISNMTNGHCDYVFQQDVLTQQSIWEAERPVKPVLEKLFKDKKLVCCNTAWLDFEKIVNTLGGPMEKKRAAELKDRLTCLPDDNADDGIDCPRKRLKVRGNVRLRSKIVFNFGYRIKALTVSANEGFVRSAEQQGVTYTAYIHEPRALTEGKEATAKKRTL